MGADHLNPQILEQMKHTPGPWRVDYAMGIWGADSTLIAYVLSDSSSVPTPDAQLMAAAPELLDALISAQGFLNPLSGLIETKEWDHLENVRDKIGSAIEKATGKNNSN